MFVNEKLFFPFGLFYKMTSENELEIINRTRFNTIATEYLNKNLMDMLQITQQGKIKIIFNIHEYTLESKKLTDSNNEENYKTISNRIKEFKDHPALLSWFINDEIPSIYNKFLRNITLLIHELDPNHPSYTVTNYATDFHLLMNTSDILGVDKYPIGPLLPIRYVYDLNEQANYHMLESKPMIPVCQIYDYGTILLRKYRNPIFTKSQPTLQEMLSMSWQALVGGGKGLMYYGFYELTLLDDVTPFEDVWKVVIELSEKIWKYKDVILSIDEVNKIEYTKNLNVSFRQWKYKKINYIVVVNLERNKEIFRINLLDKYKINKEFGLGNFIKNGTEIIFNLEPIDVIMIKYTKNAKKYNFLIIFTIVVIIIILIGVIAFIVKKFFMTKYKTKFFINSISKLMNDDN